MGHKCPVLRTRCIAPGRAWTQIPFTYSQCEKYCTAGQATGDNICDAEKMCRVNAWLRQEHRHTLIIFNTHCSSTATLVTRTRLIIALYVHACRVKFQMWTGSSTTWTQLSCRGCSQFLPSTSLNRYCPSNSRLTYSSHIITMAAILLHTINGAERKKLKLPIKSISLQTIRVEY
jgi:hypothetical protein